MLFYQLHQGCPHHRELHFELDDQDASLSDFLQDSIKEVKNLGKRKSPVKLQWLKNKLAQR